MRSPQQQNSAKKFLSYFARCLDERSILGRAAMEEVAWPIALTAGGSRFQIDVVRWSSDQ